MKTRTLMSSSAKRWPRLYARCQHWTGDQRIAGHVSFRICVGDEADDDACARHLALTRWEAPDLAEIVLSPRLEDMPMDIQDGIILHEIGHVLYGPASPRQHFDTVERGADSAAERLFGVEISYTRHSGHLQTLGPGIRPRPRGLR